MPNVTQSNHLASAALAQQPPSPAAASVDTQALAQQLALNDGEQVQLTSYTVKKGDTLWDIADVKLGNPTQWPILFALNKEQIQNPDLIFPGQVLSVPQKVEAAPPQTQPPISSPLDETSPEPVIDEAPVYFEPEPEAEPAPVQAPVQEPAPEPMTQAPVAPPEPAPEPEPVTQAPPQDNNGEITLRHPSTLPALPPRLEALPAAEPEAPVQEPVEAPVEEPTAEPVQEQPSAPAPQPQQPAPVDPFPSVVGLPPSEAQSSGVGRAAIIGGVVGTAGAGAALVGMTAKIGSNLGGYATAQVVAKGLNSVTTRVGLKVPTGPALSTLIKRVGGPKVAGSVAAVGTGLAVAGLAAGGYYLYNKVSGSDDNQAASQAPQIPAGSQAPQLPNSGSAADILGQLQGAPAPTQAPEAPQPSQPAPAQAPQPAPQADNAPATQGAKFEQLNDLLSQKKYIFMGGPTQPDAVRATSVQIWLDGNLQDRLQLSNTLVENGQSEILGRIMNHQETQPLEVAQLMTQGDFPVSKFMNDLSDNRAFLVLNSLADIAATGESQSAGVILATVEAYDGFRDREAPFEQLRQHQQAQGTWNQLPGSVQRGINELLK